MLWVWLPILYALLLWWFATGLVLYLDRLPPRTYPLSLLGASLLLVLSFVVLWLIRQQPHPLGAFVGFTAGLLIWGWGELTYFMDFITGPRKHSCPPGCAPWRRFWLAIQTSLYHELAILALAAMLALLSWGQPNQLGVWTFAILWWMRWSAKLNLFLGVPNLNEDWLPAHLRFLTSYLPKREMNLLFPVSVTVATVIMSVLVERALSYPIGSFPSLSLLLAATLLALAILEHWFLVLPLADAALWNWAFDPRATTDAVGSASDSSDTP